MASGPVHSKIPKPDSDWVPDSNENHNNSDSDEMPDPTPDTHLGALDVARARERGVLRDTVVDEVVGPAQGQFE